MPVKSIIDVDVNTEAFKSFQAQFQKYQDALAKMPKSWQQATKEQKTSVSLFDKLTQSMLAQARAGNALSTSGESWSRQLTQSDRLWSSMERSTKSLSSHITTATRSILSWGGMLTGGAAGGALGLLGSLAGGALKFIGNGIGGLLGSGDGLLGLDRMAAGTAAQRRSAKGLGLSMGAHSAFGIDFGRFVDTDSYLAYISEAESNPAAATGMYALGQSQTGNTEADALAMMRRMRSRAKSTPGNIRGLLGKSLGLPADSEALRVLAGTSNEEFNQQMAHYQTDRSKLNIEDPTARKWQDFTSQLDRAGSEVNKIFVTKLVPLEPSLEKLSTGFIKLANTIADSSLVQMGIGSISKWMTDFSNTINNSGFQASVETFVDDVGALADALSTVVKDKTARGTKTRFLDQLATLEENSGLPKGLLTYQFQRESGGALNPRDNKGHVGPFQFDPKTADWLNQMHHKHLDPRKPGEAAVLADYYDEWAEKRYKGDVGKVIASYNYGAGNLEKVLRQHPNDWQRYVPAETRGYLAGAPPSLRVDVHVHTTPGSDVVGAAAAMSH